MKRISAEKPYNDYWLYVVYHRKENRRMANLVSKADKDIRTTISYARYLMSVNLNRVLDKDEHVDHIDNDKMNDVIINLQILSPQENKLKQEIHNSFINPKFVTLKCSSCGVMFEYPTKNYRFHSKRGRQKFNCSQQCGYESLRIKHHI